MFCFLSVLLIYRYVKRNKLQIIYTIYNIIPSIWCYYVLFHTILAIVNYRNVSCEIVDFVETHLQAAWDTSIARVLR